MALLVAIVSPQDTYYLTSWQPFAKITDFVFRSTCTTCVMTEIWWAWRKYLESMT